MQAFLLACYICLQLTNLPNLDQHTILKRDNSCDQCLTGIFDQSELYSFVGTESKQATGRLLTSNRPLKQALEERLMLELSRSSLKPKAAPQKEEIRQQPVTQPMQQTVPQDQVKKTQTMVEDAVKAGEVALKTIQEKVILDIKRKTEEMSVQLQQQQAQLVRELELQGARQREILTKEMETMKQLIKAFAREESKRRSGSMDALMKNYFEFLGGAMKEMAGLTPHDWENVLNEAKSLLNEVTSQDIGKIMKEAQSILKGLTPQDIGKIMKEAESLMNDPSSLAENLMKDLLPKKEQPKTKIPNRNVLQNEVTFKMGESLICENGRYKMKMQNNAQLVIIDQYQQDRIVKTIGNSRSVGNDYHLIMQGDGNLVIYADVQNGKSVNPTWHSGTNSSKGRSFYLKLENNGQLVMYNAAGRQIWTSAEGRPGWKSDL